MNSITSKIAMAFALIAFAAPILANADHHGKSKGQRKRGMPGAQARIERQKAHIQKALDKGKITQEQATALQNNVDAIQAKKQAAMADGQITKEERSEIKSDLNASKQGIRNAIKPGDSSAGGGAVPAPSSSEPSSGESSN